MAAGKLARAKEKGATLTVAGLVAAFAVVMSYQYDHHFANIFYEMGWLWGLGLHNVLVLFPIFVLPFVDNNWAKWVWYGGILISYIGNILGAIAHVTELEMLDVMNGAALASEVSWATLIFAGLAGVILPTLILACGQVLDPLITYIVFGETEAERAAKESTALATVPSQEWQDQYEVRVERLEKKFDTFADTFVGVEDRIGQQVAAQLAAALPSPTPSHAAGSRALTGGQNQSPEPVASAAKTGQRFNQQTGQTGFDTGGQIARTTAPTSEEKPVKPVTPSEKNRFNRSTAAIRTDSRGGQTPTKTGQPAGGQTGYNQPRDEVKRPVTPEKPLDKKTAEPEEKPVNSDRGGERLKPTSIEARPAEFTEDEITALKLTGEGGSKRKAKERADELGIDWSESKIYGLVRDAKAKNEEAALEAMELARIAYEERKNE